MGGGILSLSKAIGWNKYSTRQLVEFSFELEFKTRRDDGPAYCLHRLFVSQIYKLRYNEVEVLLKEKGWAARGRLFFFLCSSE